MHKGKLTNINPPRITTEPEFCFDRSKDTVFLIEKGIVLEKSEPSGESLILPDGSIIKNDMKGLCLSKRNTSFISSLQR